MKNLLASLKLVGLTLLVCCVAYPLAVLAVARIAVPDKAEGSLVRDAAGNVLGSRLIAQAFSKPSYFWPRPSGVNYDASATGGSNLSPTSTALAERAAEALARHGTSPGGSIPAELVTASGSGLDPHLTLRGAEFQVRRVAEARNRELSDVRAVVESMAFSPTGDRGSARLVNVLELNLALDQLPKP
jgi:K+-transporting ATPase ATPase C chain